MSSTSLSVLLPSSSARGLDRPAPVRFAEMFADLVTFDFGTKILTQEPVLDDIWHPMMNSLLMASVAVVITPLVAIVLGAAAALKPGGQLDGVISGVTLFTYSMPDFVVANIFIIVFALQLGLAPAILMIPESAPAWSLLDLCSPGEIETRPVGRAPLRCYRDSPKASYYAVGGTSTVGVPIRIYTGLGQGALAILGLAGWLPGRPAG